MVLNSKMRNYYFAQII